MSVSDPIADMLTAIRNASMVKKSETDVRGSRLAEEILKLFKKESYVKNFKRREDKKRLIRVYLKFGRDQHPAITQLKKISKPGRRIYVRHNEIPEVLGGLGTAVLSTSRGILTGREAREAKVGGEVLCYIW